MEQEHIADDAEDDERDRHRERVRAACSQRVGRVRDDRPGGDEREQPIDDHERIPVQHAPARGRRRRHEHEFPTPLAEREDEREKRRTEQKPR